MPPSTPPKKVFYTQPRYGQVMIQCPEKGLDRGYNIGHVGSLAMKARFDKDGAPVEVLEWRATIFIGPHMARVIGIGDGYLEGDGAWHVPTEAEAQWPGVREALADAERGAYGGMVPKTLTVDEVRNIAIVATTNDISALQSRVETVEAKHAHDVRVGEITSSTVAHLGERLDRLYSTVGVLSAPLSKDDIAAIVAAEVKKALAPAASATPTPRRGANP